MQDPFIIWIDDEPNLIEAEIFDVELSLGMKTKVFENPTVALDWLLANENDALAARAIVIDLLMPSGADDRLLGGKHDPVGKILCKYLMDNLACWSKIQDWVTLYSRSAMNDAIGAARRFAGTNGIAFAEKHESSRIAEELIERGRIRI